jgi:hypothetical protein
MDYLTARNRSHEASGVETVAVEAGLADALAADTEPQQSSPSVTWRRQNSRLQRAFSTPSPLLWIDVC